MLLIYWKTPNVMTWICYNHEKDGNFLGARKKESYKNVIREIF